MIIHYNNIVECLSDDWGIQPSSYVHSLSQHWHRQRNQHLFLKKFSVDVIKVIKYPNDPQKANIPRSGEKVKKKKKKNFNMN
jgi:hypothetical protein